MERNRSWSSERLGDIEAEHVWGRKMLPFAEEQDKASSVAWSKGDPSRSRTGAMNHPTEFRDSYTFTKKNHHFFLENLSPSFYQST